jgi:hypothetical protein
MARRIDPDERTFDTMPRRDADTRDRRGLLTILLVLLAAVVAVVAGWVLSERASSPDTAIPVDIERLLDDYVTAWNGWDRDAYLSLVTDDAIHQTPTGSRTANVHAGVIEDFRVIDLHVTPVGEPILFGDGPWYIAQVVRVTATTYTEDRGGIMTLTIVDDNGVPKISRHVYSGSLGPG